MTGELAAVRHELVGRVAVVAVAGEIDLSNAQAVGEAILDRARAGEALVLDLAGLDYVDSAGLRMLTRVVERCGMEQRPFCLAVPPEARIFRVLEVTGIAASVPLAGEPAAAIARVRAEGSA